MKKITIAIHGGAGTLIKGKMTAEKETAYKAALEEALQKGYEVLKKGESAMNAVEAAVCSLEDSPLFNAGKGSVFTATGTHEMDASIMDGKDLKAGAVTSITGIKNPISLARDVMNHTEHVFLGGQGAMDFAKSLDYEIMSPNYFHDDLRHDQWQQLKDTDQFQLDHSLKKDSKFGTVGAVALDQDGNIAAATSTGGMTNKRFGRVGDSPMIGAGTYANNKTCAVSCTGSGEYFIRGVVAYDVSALMEYKGLSLMDASNEVIQKRILEIGGDGGLIAVDKEGNLALPFNTEGMYRAFIDINGNKVIAIYKN
ncbi:MAG: isoaspartyl peptidase/L-asparaginase [Saprospiraceae bacterium]|nr:isoaspartyl peptidase/L-asparaginase [Saprospiraceae bacterium]